LRKLPIFGKVTKRENTRLEKGPPKSFLRKKSQFLHKKSGRNTLAKRKRGTEILREKRVVENYLWRGWGTTSEWETLLRKALKRRVKGGGTIGEPTTSGIITNKEDNLKTAIGERKVRRKLVRIPKKSGGTRKARKSGNLKGN